MLILNWRKKSDMEHNYQKDIKTFFDYDADKILQKRMLDEPCFDTANDAIAYIRSIINIPIESIIEHIKQMKRQPIYSFDVFQFSDFENATKNLCTKIKCTDNSGLNFIEVGKILLDDGCVRKDGAYTKYGENHIKTAELIGLAFKCEGKYYLSPIGCVFNNLSETEKNQLLTRLILRNKLISQSLLVALNDAFYMKSFLYELSESTYIRRKPNIKHIIEILNSSTEYDFVNITKNIKL